MISVKGTEALPRGSFLLTTVYSDMDTTITKLVQSQMSGRAVILPRRELVPPAMSMEEYSELVMEMMEESKTVSKIVALRQAGVEVQATGEGARVQKLLPGTMAEGILQEGDVVVEAEGQRIQAAPDLVNLVRRQKPGAAVSLKVMREGDPFEVQVGTKESDSEPGIAVIGILIKTHQFGHNLPVQIEIDSENIGGPSAGLMFTLGILEALEGRGLAAGHRVAGTGTISLDGSVGPVGGIGPKVIGAEEAGADYFLAPQDNFEAAKQAARRIQVIPVATLGDAVSFLRGLRPAARGAMVPFVPPARLDIPLPAAA